MVTEDVLMIPSILQASAFMFRMPSSPPIRRLKTGFPRAAAGQLRQQV